jgi:hypothetical protein
MLWMGHDDDMPNYSLSHKSRGGYQQHPFCFMCIWRAGLVVVCQKGPPVKKANIPLCFGLIARAAMA